MQAAYPDFLGIGAQKAGTTWLYRNLQAHPAIWLPPEKELHYFDEKRVTRPTLLARIGGDSTESRRWRRQLRRHARRTRHGVPMDDLRWYARYFLAGSDDAWYASLFAQANGRTTGEVTPSYALLDSERVAVIRRLMPDARIVFLMRNPIERAWSHAMMDVRNRGNSVESSECLRHFESEASRLRTDYLRTLRVWGQHFPGEQIFVGFLEDIHFHPERLLARVCEFLGLGAPDRWQHAEARVYSGTEASIPSRLALALAKRYAHLAGELGERFGGYASFWSYCADRLVAEPPADGVSAALYADPLWSAWIAERGGEAPLQSAPLSHWPT